MNAQSPLGRSVGMLLTAGVGFGMLLTAGIVREGGALVPTNAVASLLAAVLPAQSSVPSAHGKSAKELTEQLLGATDKKAQLALAKQRRAALRELAKTNPQAFLDAAISEESRKKLPSDVQTELERDVEIEGAITVLVSVPASVDTAMLNPHEEVSYSLVGSDGQRVYLHPVSGDFETQTGSIVKVRGKKLDDQLVLAAPDSQSVKVVTPVVSPSTGNQKVIALLVNLSTNPVEPFTVGDIEAKLSAPGTSVDAYYREASFGKVSVSATVRGWLTVTPAVTTGCAYSSWVTLAKEAAAKNGIDLSQYKRQMFFFPYLPDCKFGGIATLGGNWLYINGDQPIQVIAHELGHNLGVQHASAYFCGALAIDVPANCQGAEYSDTADVMGSYTYVPGHMNGPHKLALQWFTSAQVQAVSGTGGTYTLTPINTPLGLKMLKIPKANTGESYYVSYRSPKAVFDTQHYDRVRSYYTGAEVHLWNGVVSARTKLLDAHPPAATPLGDTGRLIYLTDQPLSDGASIVDKINGVTITQLSHNADGVTIQVTLSGSGGGGSTGGKGGGKKP